VAEGVKAMPVWLAAFLMVPGLALAAGPTCAGGGNNAPHPISADQAGKAKELFGLSMPDDMLLRTTMARCMEGHLYMCNVGANLPCGKADVSDSLPGVAAWCHDNPNTAIVPAFVTGHDTVYRWACVDGVARAGKPIQSVDPAGYFARYWKRAD
jgi:hypothetical protein